MWWGAQRPRRRGRIVLIVLLTAGLAGCPTDLVDTVAVAAVEVAPDSMALDVGQSDQLTATPLDADGNALDRPISWTTSDGAVARVSGSGEVAAVAVGTTTVTASCEGVTGTADVSVSDPVAEVVVTPAELVLTRGDSAQLAATVIGVSGDTLDRPVTWTSGDEGVATVDDQGGVTAVAAGSTAVAATSEGRADSATVEVYAVLAVVTDALRSGTVDAAYADTLAADGGDGVYTWSLAAGALPDGLSLDAAGVISGTPTTAGTTGFTAQVESGDGQTATAQLAVTVTLGLDRVYVAAYYELDAIDLAADTVAATLDVEHGNAIAIHPTGDRAYVTSCMDDAISVIDLAADAVTGTLPLAACHDIAFTPDGSRAFAVGTGVYAIDPTTDAVTRTIPAGSGPTGIAITPDGSRAVVVNNSSDDVTLVDLGPDTVVATIPVGELPWYAAISPDGARAYVTNNGPDNVSVIDLASATVTATIELPGSNPGPIHLAIAPDGGTVYVASTIDPSVAVIDTESNAVTATIDLGYAPGEVAVAPDGSRVFVASTGTWQGAGSYVQIIDAASNALVDQVYIGWMPNALAVTPDGP